MAELADALDLGSSGATRTGSIPASCTRLIIIMPIGHFIFFITLVLVIIALSVYYFHMKVNEMNTIKQTFSKQAVYFYYYYYTR